MAKSFYQRITLADGRDVAVHVNRRGCKGRWTKEDAAALQQLVEAARTQFVISKNTSHSTEDSDA